MCTTKQFMVEAVYWHSSPKKTWRESFNKARKKLKWKEDMALDRVAWRSRLQKHQGKKIINWIVSELKIGFL